MLEVGCGAGRFLELLAAAGAEVWGVDLSLACAVAAENTVRFPNCCVAQADLFHLPFGADFDAVFSFGVLHHTPDPPAAFAAIARHLKPGGRIIVWVYSRKRGTGWIPRPYQVYGRVVRALPERYREPVLAAYTQLALAAAAVPVLSPLFRRALPIQDLRLKGPLQDGYEPDQGHREARERLRREWALHSAFDMLTPTFTRQFTPDQVLSWARRAGLAEVRPLPVEASVTGVRPS